MDSTEPIYHPSFAKNYLQVYNNLNQNGSYLWYDSENPENIAYPSDFTLKKTSSWNSTLNLRLNSVVLNSNSSLNSHTAFPTAEGSFNATLRKQNGAAPTINLYFMGNIAKNNINVYPEVDYTPGGPSSVTISNPYFNLSPTTFPSTSNIIVSWGVSNTSVSFSPSTFFSNGNTYTYVYEGDSITFTNSWNNESRWSDKRSPSQSDYKSFSPPSDLDSLTQIPTVYCNWQVNWGYICSSVCEHCNHCSDYGGSTYQPWTATHLQGYYGYVRSEPSFNATVLTIYPISEQVTVTSKSGDWYYIIFDSVSSASTASSGWCHKNGISGTDPNDSGGGCVCNSDTCSSDTGGCSCYNHLCNHTCNENLCDDFIYCGGYS